MEATKNTTVKEREFIAAVEAHRNAEGKVIAWDIYANGNGKVIFENATKDRYSCAYVVMMSDGSMYLHFDGSLSHPYGRKTYRRKGNALKGFGMQEGRNESKQPATPTETPRISTETAETVNVSAEEGEKEAETKENCHSDTRIVSDGYGTQYEVTRHWENGRVESLDVIVLDTQPQTAKEPSQTPETPQTVEYTVGPYKLAKMV